MKNLIILIINCLSLITIKTSCYAASDKKLTADSLLSTDAKHSFYAPEDADRKAPPMGFKRQYESVLPPFSNVEVEKNVYEIEASSPKKLKDPRSGTEITIPAHAFIDAKGKPVQGKIVIDYREFRDAADFIVSGIPMSFTANDSITFFKSGGMFEINASQDGQEVYLAPGKQVFVNFISTDTAAYNFYSFNDKENRWDVRGTADASKTKNTELKKLPRAYQYYRSYSNVRFPVYDSASFATRFDSCNYYFTKRRSENYASVISGNSKFLFKQRNIFTKKNSGNQQATPTPIIEGNGTFYKINNLVKVRSIKKTKEGGLLFSLRTNFLTHPEMNIFSSCQWVTTDKFSIHDFKKQYAERMRFNDVRIQQSGEGYVIKLKADSGIYSINAIPVKLSKKKGKTIAQPFSPRYKEYNKSLATRERAFNKRMKRGKLPDNQYYPKQNSEEKKRTAWALTKGVMNEEEKQMSYEEWQKYYAELTANESKVINASAASGEGLMRSLSLDGFGIYNCDQIRRIADPVIVHAKYSSGTKKDIPITCTYIIDEKINGVLSYSTYGKYTPSKIVFGKHSKNRMVVTKENGDIAIFTKEQFGKNKFSDRSKFTFDVKEINSKVNSVEDMRKILAL